MGALLERRSALAAARTKDPSTLFHCTAVASYAAPEITKDS